MVTSCKANCQFIILEIASANSVDKTWVSLWFRWNFESLRCLTVIVSPWFKNCHFFFLQYLSFDFGLANAVFLWYWSFFSVIADIETSQFLLSLMTKLIIPSTIWSGSFLVSVPFVPTWKWYEWPFLSVLVEHNPPNTLVLRQKSS